MLRCSTTADFLAALPHIAGFTAENSLFVALFDGRRSSGAVRIDLPGSEAGSAETLSFLDGVSTLLRRVGAGRGRTAPAIAIVTSIRFSEAGRIPWRDLARRLQRRLERDGVELRELCCLAPDGWGAYRDPGTPATGRPLSDISASELAPALAVLSAPPPRLESIGALPAAPPRLRAAVLAALENAGLPQTSGASGNPPRPLAPEPSRPDEAHESVEALRAVIEAADPTPTELATLIGRAQQPTLWMFMVFALTAGASEAVDLASVPGAGALFGLPVAPLDSRRPTGAPSSLSIRAVVTAVCSGPPSSSLLRSQLERLGHAVSCCPEPLRPALLALRAVGYWTLGLASVAQRQVDLALATDPDHEIARMVADVLVEGVPPAWAALRPRAADPTRNVSFRTRNGHSRAA